MLNGPGSRRSKGGHLSDDQRVDRAGDATVIKAEGIGSAFREVASGVLPVSCRPVPATSETGLCWSNRGGTTGGHRTLVPCPGRGFFYSRRATLPPHFGLSIVDCRLRIGCLHHRESAILDQQSATIRPPHPGHKAQAIHGGRNVQRNVCNQRFDRRLSPGSASIAIPTHWYNIQADLPTPAPAAPHPGTKQPIGPQASFPVSAVLTQRQACAIVAFTIEYRRIKAVNRTSRHTSEASESQPNCCEVGASAHAEWTGEPQVESGLSMHVQP